MKEERKVNTAEWGMEEGRLVCKVEFDMEERR